MTIIHNRSQSLAILNHCWWGIRWLWLGPIIGFMFKQALMGCSGRLIQIYGLLAVDITKGPVQPTIKMCFVESTQPSMQWTKGDLHNFQLGKARHFRWNQSFPQKCNLRSPNPNHVEANHRCPESISINLPSSCITNHRVINHASDQFLLNHSLTIMINNGKNIID